MLLNDHPDDSWPFEASYRRHKKVVRLLLRCKKTDVGVLNYDDFVASYLSYFHNFPEDDKYRRQSLLHWVRQRAPLLGLAGDAVEDREQIIRDRGETCPN